MTRQSFVKTGLMLGVWVGLSSCTAIHPPMAHLPSRDSIIPGEQITVEKNQNVYAIARKYNVPMRDLIVLNTIPSPYTIHAGQKLTLPAGDRDASSLGNVSGPTMPPPSPSTVTVVEQATLPPVKNLPPPVETKPTPMVKPTHAESAAALTTPSPVKNVTTTASPQQQLALATQSLPKPPEDAPTITFVWPVQGPVLSAYGPKGEGLNNDGVNIGAPKGAPVVAAASGIVVYSGNEMKGFGNLVLIRHQGGWVTAYAHLDRTLVTKDAVVAQGDMIGTVGKSGNVNAPQLHFETRYQGKAVDPSSAIKG